MNRIVYRLVPLAIAAALFATGCAEHPTQPTPVSSGSSTTSGSTSTGSSSSSTGTTPRTAAAGEAVPAESASTGIPACDDYLASYKGCHRAAEIYAPDTIDQHYEEMHDSLVRQSRDPATRSELAARCTSLANQLKQALHGKACEPEQPAAAGSAPQP
jgi:hypothetical protein